MRYLARSTSSSLYNENDATVCEIDARLDSFCLALTSVSQLANHIRGTNKLDKKEEAEVRKVIMNQLKEFDNLVKVRPNLAFNLSDILLFATLSCLPEANTQKALKGMKGLAQRWTEVSQGEKENDN